MDMKGLEGNVALLRFAGPVGSASIRPARQSPAGGKDETHALRDGSGSGPHSSRRICSAPAP